VAYRRLERQKGNAERPKPPYFELNRAVTGAKRSIKDFFVPFCRNWFYYWEWWVLISD
jgi:hypothetical protein